MVHLVLKNVLPMGVAVALCLAVSGCVAHQSVGRPPSPAEIERINTYAQVHGDLRIDYVDPLPVCAAGLCGIERQPEEIVRLVSATARDTVVQTEDGRRWTLRTETIASAHARNRTRGAAVGALIGLSVGIALTGGAYALSQSNAFRDPDPSAPPPSPTTGADVLKLGVLLTVTQTMGWAALGYLFGGRESFDFGGPATSTEH